jgi:hypothetical protein
MDDPLAVIYENSMLRSFGAALALGAAPLAAAKDSVEDYKKAAVQIAEYIKTFDKQIELTGNIIKKMRLEKEKENEQIRLDNFIQKLREKRVSEDELRYMGLLDN